MRSFWKTLYTIILIPLLWLALQILGLVNAKVRRGIRGRRSLFPDLVARANRIARGPRVWFHASSLGEFEQAKPVIAELKRRRPEVRIIASFFSPSGYEHSLQYPLADVITYLPFDTPGNARRFLDIVRPDVAVMVRYDIWPNMIWELDRRGIPALIANATMRHASPRFLPGVRNFHHHLYSALRAILTVSELDVEAFQRFTLGDVRLEAVGDTRFDQVTIRSREARKRRLLPESVTRGKQVIVAGSTWPEDEEVLLPAFRQVHTRMPATLLVLVPHEPTLEHLEDLERRMTNGVRSIRFSALNEYAGEAIIIVDSIGILLMLYAAAHAAYVGGSFRQGIHNVLEAAVYGIPVAFGPRHRNSHEPQQLADAGGGFVVENAEALAAVLERLLADPTAREDAGRHATAFVSAHTGATERFLAILEAHLPEGRAE